MVAMVAVSCALFCLRVLLSVWLNNFPCIFCEISLSVNLRKSTRNLEANINKISGNNKRKNLVYAAIFYFLLFISTIFLCYVNEPWKIECYIHITCIYYSYLPFSVAIHIHACIVSSALTWKFFPFHAHRLVVYVIVENLWVYFLLCVHADYT